MRFQKSRPPKDYRSAGIMLDRDDTELMLTVSLWWLDVAWAWRR